MSVDQEGGAGPARRLPMLALLVATAVSTTGNSLALVAIPWFVLQTTGSAAKTGLVGGAMFLAAVLAGLFGGPVVDRLGPRRASVVADLASGASVAAIPLLHGTVGLAFWQLVVLVFLGGLLDAPGVAARQSLVPRLARRAGMGMERANSSFQAVQRFSGLFGPPLGGVLVAALGSSNVLLLDAATFAASAVAVAAAVPSAPRSAERAETRGAYLAELFEGLRFVRRDRLLFSIVVGGVVLNFFGEPVGAVVMPVYASEVYGRAVGLGLLLGAFGGGALAGAVLFGAAGHALPRRAAFCGSLVLRGLPLLVLATAPPLPVGMAAMAVSGLGVGTIDPLVSSVIQERAPADMLGRTFGTFFALTQAAAPVGMVCAGYSLESFGARAVLVGVAAGYLPVMAYALLSPAFGKIGEPTPNPDRPATETSKGTGGRVSS